MNKEYQTLIHRKEFEFGMKRKKENIEAEIIKIESYLTRLSKPIIFVDTKDTEEKPPNRRAEVYKSTIKL